VQFTDRRDAYSWVIWMKVAIGSGHTRRRVGKKSRTLIRIAPTASGTRSATSCGGGSFGEIVFLLRILIAVVGLL